MDLKKIVAFTACVVVFLSMLGVLTAFVKPAAAEQVTLFSHTGYLDTYGDYVVCGEVKNNGGTAATNVYVKITYISDSGGTEDQTAIVLNVLMPGRRAPFYDISSQQGSLVKSYNVELMDLTMPSEDLPELLETVSSNCEISVDNYITISGTIMNDGAETAIYNRVYSTFYDGPSGTGNVVAVTSGVTDPYNLNPGQTGDFQTGFYAIPGISYVSFVLTAESANYAALREYVGEAGLASTTTPSPTSQTPQPSASSNTQISNPPSKNPCIIATATYGGPFASEVVFMRSVRDDLIGSSPTGSVLVKAWNTFYYSWSPPVAKAIGCSSALKLTFSGLLLPLLGSMYVVSGVYDSLAWLSPDLAAVISFSVAATLSIAIYIFLPAVVVRHMVKFDKNLRLKHIVSSIQNIIS
jgi:hypothetical protein